MITIGPVTIYPYGLIIGAAIATGWWLFDVVGTRSGLSESWRSRLVWAGLLGGIVGARLYHVLDFWAYYAASPGEIVKVWQGGLGIWGAILGGLLGVGVVLLRRRDLWGKAVDAVALALPLSQAIGRFGNLVNRELYGWPTELPWGIYIPPEQRPAGLEQATHFQPLFLYESILCLLLFGLLWRLKEKTGYLGSGRLFGFYLMGYGLIRLVLEPLRIESWTIFNLPTAQWVSLGAIIVGAYGSYRLGLKDENKR